MRNKKRLADIEKELHMLFCSDHVKRDFEWLINRVKTLEAALEFYADERAYRYDNKQFEVMADCGDTARKALEDS